jgi:hypothetical protein
MSDYDLDPNDPLYVPEPAKSSKKRTRPARPSRNDNFIFADMDKLCRGLNAGGVVWARTLQVHAMRGDLEEFHDLGDDWLEQHGIDRFAKCRALRLHESEGRLTTRPSTTRKRGIRVALTST